jgi:hypothetical protein
MHVKKVLAVLAVAGLASSAMAQSFDARLAFRDDHVNNNTPTIESGGIHVVDVSGQTAPVTLNFSILFGAFDAQGFTNYGMFNWNGNLNVNGTGFTLTNVNGLRNPFIANPVGAGVVGANGITAIDVARSVIDQDTPWTFDGPRPTTGPVFSQGNNQYFRAYGFQVVLTDLTERDIQIDAVGLMQAIAGWTEIAAVEPEDEETPGFVRWTATSFVTDSTANGSFTLRIVPAPGAAALLGLGGLVAARRRR